MTDVPPEQAIASGPLTSYIPAITKTNNRRARTPNNRGLETAAALDVPPCTPIEALRHRVRRGGSPGVRPIQIPASQKPKRLRSKVFQSIQCPRVDERGKAYRSREHSQVLSNWAGNNNLPMEQLIPRIAFFITNTPAAP